jgi:glycosyltransferase involved in cell wall biosynthesis
MVYKTLCESLKSTAYIGVQSEAHKGIGFKGLLRLLRSKYDALQFRERINLILGMGNLGVIFKKSGYLPRVFPFGYFVETPFLKMTTQSRSMAQQIFELIFVIYFRKGWDILLYALHGLKSRDWRLHIVGDGNDRGEFVKLCTRLGLIDTVRFYGVLPNSETMGLISKSDLLVLPSRWDGWGAVVNEALMLGVPVVCSDRCGAADLLDGHERGEVFSSESISSLRSVLDRRISQGKKDPATSDKIREWSKCINGESAADYFMAVINATITGGSKPVLHGLTNLG